MRESEGGSRCVDVKVLEGVLVNIVLVIHRE